MTDPRAPHISSAFDGNATLDHAIHDSILADLDSGALRAASKNDAGKWVANEWVKQAILLGFRRWKMTLATVGDVAGDDSSPLNTWYDKVPLKTAQWGQAEYDQAGFRSDPGARVRYGAHVAKNVVLMPSFVNIGAFIDEGTMVDTWATVGSCAQIGKRVHLSGGTGIGGVLEPLQAAPTIIEDNCFIGARAEIAEGVVVRENAVIAMGTYISASTPIIDRATGETLYGEVPSGAVVVPGSRPDPKSGVNLYCTVIVKRVDAKTRAKTAINDLLRS